MTAAPFCIVGTRRKAQSRHFLEKSYLAVFPRLLLPPLRFPEIIHRKGKASLLRLHSAVNRYFCLPPENASLSIERQHFEQQDIVSTWV